MNFQTFDVFQWLATIAAGVGVAPFLSWLLEQFDAWQNVSAANKPRIVFVLSTLVSVAAYLIVAYVPPNVLTQLSPVIGIVVASFVTFYATQVVHEVRKAREIRRDAGDAARNAVSSKRSAKA